jgi:hypothetical protein
LLSPPPPLVAWRMAASIASLSSEESYSEEDMLSLFSNIFSSFSILSCPVGFLVWG